MEFEEFARAHIDQLMRLGMAVTGAQADAEDFAQEALERVYRKWPRVADSEKKWAYVRAIAINAHLSKARRRRIVEIFPGSGARTFDAPVEQSGRPVGASSQDGGLELLISQLPPRQRAVVVLRFYEDLDVADIARELGIGASSVRSTLSRALAALRVPLMQTRADRSAPHLATGPQQRHTRGGQGK